MFELPRPVLAPTPRDVIARFGTAQVLRFRPPAGVAPAGCAPILLVPSLINRWYILDLREGASLVAGLLAAGLDVYCLDWGVPEAEDRYLGWDDVLARLARATRVVRRNSGHTRVGVLGYCMGGTLTAIHAALQPEEMAALVLLAGPIDFAGGGLLRRMVDRRWFDADAVADAGNVHPLQMQAGFVALRPTLDLVKLMSMPELAIDPAARAAYLALEEWAQDNIPFPAQAYRTYIRQLYQDNELVAGEHVARGRRVHLSRISCPTMVIVAERDTICPAPAATALCQRVGTRDSQVLSVPGGHVGAVVGSKASRVMVPALSAWLRDRLSSRPAA
jgi:polyhydroxyalkanoate synthase